MSKKNNGKCLVNDERHKGKEVDRLDYIALTKTGKTGPFTAVGWTAALTIVLLIGVAIGTSFLAPGVVLAASLPSGATGADPGIIDGGSEVAGGMAWRIEIMVEYIAIGLAAIAIALRFGRSLLIKLQDWYESEPMTVRTSRLARPVPALVMPRPGHGSARVAANDHRRELHAA